MRSAQVGQQAPSKTVPPTTAVPHSLISHERVGSAAALDRYFPL